MLRVLVRATAVAVHTLPGAAARRLPAVLVPVRRFIYIPPPKDPPPPPPFNWSRDPYLPHVTQFESVLRARMQSALSTTELSAVNEAIAAGYGAYRREHRRISIRSALTLTVLLPISGVAIYLHAEPFLVFLLAWPAGHWLAHTMAERDIVQRALAVERAAVDARQLPPDSHDRVLAYLRCTNRVDIYHHYTFESLMLTGALGGAVGWLALMLAVECM